MFGLEVIVVNCNSFFFSALKYDFLSTDAASVLYLRQCLIH